MASKSGRIEFRKHDSIGNNAAEDDTAFLSRCFIDTGDLKVLLDFEDAKRVITGRTGAGKTALLHGVRNSKIDVVEIQPEHLSLNHIANSTIIQFYAELGLNLDPFYKLLWRHVFAVELFQRRYDISNEATKLGVIRRLLENDTDKGHRERREKAIAYIQRFGDQFWKDTDFRTREITTKFEEELKVGMRDSAGLMAGVPGVMGGKISLGEESGVRRVLSEEQRVQIVKRGQEVINSIQIKELSEIINLVREVLDDKVRRWFIVIDKLDENWVDDSIRYRLIRALIDTVRDFREVTNLKIVICLRNDLLERVICHTRDSGFQEEKIRSLRLNIAWSRSDLVSLIDRRINCLFRDRYTSAAIAHAEILPEDKGSRGRDKVSAIDYIINRTWRRPRDIIEFFNLCIREAAGRPRITGK